MQLKAEDHALLRNKEFENGDYIGKYFIITLKNSVEINQHKTEILDISLTD